LILLPTSKACPGSTPLPSASLRSDSIFVAPQQLCNLGTSPRISFNYREIFRALFFFCATDFWIRSGWRDFPLLFSISEDLF
jgi:hypothetical protein